MVIVILSLLNPERKLIALFSNFLSGNIFTLIHSLSKGLLEDFFRVGFLTIYHESNFEKKSAVFSLNFKQHIELIHAKVKNKEEFEAYVQKFMQDHWSDSVTNIKNMTLENTRLYANKVAHHVYTSYIQNLNQMTTTTLNETEKKVISSTNSIFTIQNFVIITIAIVFIGVFLIFYIKILS